MIAFLFNSIVSVLFPPRCFGCSKKEEPMCSSCLQSARKTLDTPYPYIISLFSFKEDVIRCAIHAIKYYHRKDLILPLAHALAKELENSVGSRLQADGWVLVPIPMPLLRKLSRGYNQAELIAIALGNELSLPVRMDILKRKRSPVRQVKTSTRSERRHNQISSFLVKKNPTDMRIILVDDVTTTGATLDEARRSLLAKRAANVLAVTVAH